MENARRAARTTASPKTAVSAVFRARRSVRGTAPRPPRTRSGRSAATPRSSTSLLSQYSGAENHPMAVTPRTVDVSQSISRKPGSQQPRKLFVGRRSRARRHRHHRGGQRRKRNQRQQLHTGGMAGVAVDRPPRVPRQCRAGQDQPAGAAATTVSRVAAPPGRSAPIAGRVRRPTPRHRPAGDHAAGGHHRDGGPRPGRPGARAGWVVPTCRRCATTPARPAAAAAPAHRQARPVQRVGGERQRDGARRPRRAPPSPAASR